MSLNKASLDELRKSDMIGEERAMRIVEYRDEHGGIKDWDELKSIPGFSDQMVEDLQESGVTL